MSASYSTPAVGDEEIFEDTARDVERQEGDNDQSGDYVPGTDATAAATGDDARDGDAVADEAFEGEEDGSNGASGDLTNRQIGGFKATLKNPNTSEQAKNNASEKLQSAGVNA